MSDKFYIKIFSEKNIPAKKRVIIITGPCGAGKTTLALNLAKAAGNSFYFDKDDMVPVSNAAFVTAGEPIDRHSDFFRKYIRDSEYEALDLIIRNAVMFNDNVIINAPYGGEVKNEKTKAVGDKRISELQSFVNKYGADLIVIACVCDKEELYQRLKNRIKKDAAAKLRDGAAFSNDNALREFVDAQDTAGFTAKCPHIDFCINFNSDDSLSSFVKLCEYLNIENCGYDIDYTVNRHKINY